MINPVENKSIYKKIINKKKYSKKIFSKNFIKENLKKTHPNIEYIKKILVYKTNVSFENGLNNTIDCFISK